MCSCAILLSVLYMRNDSSHIIFSDRRAGSEGIPIKHLHGAHDFLKLLGPIFTSCKIQTQSNHISLMLFKTMVNTKEK